MSDFTKQKLIWLIVGQTVLALVVGALAGYYESGLASQHSWNIPLLLVPHQQVTTDEETKLIAVVKRTTPAVVSIVASKDVTYIEQGYTSPFSNFCGDPFFRQFLGSQCDVPTQTPRQYSQHQQVAAGTGFLISSDGLILTNKHVVDISGADFTIITNDGKKYPGKLLAKDPTQDLALLKISALSMPYLQLGDSSKAQIGQTVIAIGNALGQFSNTVSKGVVSGLSRSIVVGDNSGSSEKLDQVIQTDAAINPGNSGGPLINLSGQVIGIDTAIVQGAQNIGFAIPINQAKKYVAQIENAGKPATPAPTLTPVH